MDVATLTPWLAPLVPLVPAYYVYRAKINEIKSLYDQEKLKDKTAQRDDNREDFNAVLATLRSDLVDLKAEVKEWRNKSCENETTIIALRKELLESDRKMFLQEQEIIRLKNAEVVKNAEYERRIQQLTDENKVLTQQYNSLRAEHDAMKRIIDSGAASAPDTIL